MDKKNITHENVVNYLWRCDEDQIMTHDFMVDDNLVDMNHKIMSHENVVNYLWWVMEGKIMSHENVVDYSCTCNWP